MVLKEILKVKRNRAVDEGLVSCLKFTFVKERLGMMEDSESGAGFGDDI